jgi:hypothetical protein
MTTLTFDDNLIPVAKYMADKHSLNEAEASAFIAGFVEGWRTHGAERDHTIRDMRERYDRVREQSELMWTGLIECLLLVEKDHPVSQRIENVLWKLERVR